MNVDEKALLYTLLNEYKGKAKISLWDISGLLSIHIKDADITKQFCDDINRIPSISHLWGKTIKVFDNERTINALDTARSILINLVTLGTDNTLEKLENLLDQNGGTYYYINTITGLRFDKSYRILDIDIVNLKDLPETIEEQWHARIGRTYPYSYKGPLNRDISAAFLYRDVFTIQESRNEANATPVELALKISKTMNVLAEIIPLTTFCACYQRHHKSILGNSVLLGTDEGSAVADNEIRLSTPKTTHLNSSLIEDLSQKYINLDQNAQQRIGSILQRFNMACARQNESDVLIELRIIVESILSRDRQDNEPITHIISLRGAWLLGQSLEERITLSRLIKKLYGLSSSAVHGSYTYDTKHQEQIAQYKELCANLIKKEICSSVPSNAEQWNEMIMGRPHDSR